MLMTNYKLLLRNLNSTTENSDSFKDGDDQQLLSLVELNVIDSYIWYGNK